VAIGSRTFWLARKGNTPAEYEDASAANEAAGRYALADGATESCFAGLWARLLVEDFVKDCDADLQSWPDSISFLQVLWDAEVQSRPIPWHAQRGVDQGAFGTFLGITLAACPEGPCQWQAVAVGDTCLLHTRGDALLRAFPVECSKEFGNAPKLVGSRMSLDEIRKRESLWTDGRGQPGDRLWMMTDALAHWSLVEHEAGRNPWGELESLLSGPETGEHFASWVEGLRDVRGLRNDDVTLLAIHL